MAKLVKQARYLAVAAVAVLPGCANDDVEPPSFPENVPALVTTTTAPQPQVATGPNTPVIAIRGPQALIACLDTTETDQDDAQLSFDDPQLLSITTDESDHVIFNVSPRFSFVGEDAPDYIKAQLTPEFAGGEINLQPNTDRFVIGFKDGEGKDIHFGVSVSPDNQVIVALLGSKDRYDVLSDISTIKIPGTDIALPSFTVGFSPDSDVVVRGPGDGDYIKIPLDLSVVPGSFDTTGLSVEGKRLDTPGTQSEISVFEPSVDVACQAIGAL